jgi:hypothetical protein
MNAKKVAHYASQSYDTKERFISYWHQIHEVLGLHSPEILEVGIGNGFFSDYLKKRKMDVITLDKEIVLKPDVVGSVLTLPFHDSSFHTVACFELMEHLPYERFCDSLSEIFRVSKLYGVLSLPDINKAYRFNIQLPGFNELKKLISIPRIRGLKQELDGKHYWEIGMFRFPLIRVLKDIRKVGFEVKKTYRIFEFPWHRFFVLTKIS